MPGFSIAITLVVALFIVVLFSIRIVPQGEEWVVQRLGKFKKVIKPGLNIIIPFIDSIRAKITTRDIILDVAKQEVITKDNAVIIANAVAFIKITDPVKHFMAWKISNWPFGI